MHHTLQQNKNTIALALPTNHFRQSFTFSTITPSRLDTTNMPPRPPISPEKRKERYLEAVRDKMAKLYAYGDAKPPAREQLWHEIKGFLKAGKLLSNFTAAAWQAIIAEELLNANGIMREEHQLKQKLATTDDEQDWDKYDVPPRIRLPRSEVITPK